MIKGLRKSSTGVSLEWEGPRPGLQTVKTLNWRSSPVRNQEEPSNKNHLWYMETICHLLIDFVEYVSLAPAAASHSERICVTLQLFTRPLGNLLFTTSSPSSIATWPWPHCALNDMDSKLSPHCFQACGFVWCRWPCLLKHLFFLCKYLFLWHSVVLVLFLFFSVHFLFPLRHNPESYPGLMFYLQPFDNSSFSSPQSASQRWCILHIIHCFVFPINYKTLRLT